jgi:hypothetical protein
VQWYGVIKQVILSRFTSLGTILTGAISFLGICTNIEINDITQKKINIQMKNNIDRLSLRSTNPDLFVFMFFFD